jgi:hypothetical protein
VTVHEDAVRKSGRLAAWAALPLLWLTTGLSYAIFLSCTLAANGPFYDVLRHRYWALACRLDLFGRAAWERLGVAKGPPWRAHEGLELVGLVRLPSNVQDFHYVAIGSVLLLIPLVATLLVHGLMTGVLITRCTRCGGVVSSTAGQGCWRCGGRADTAGEEQLSRRGCSRRALLPSVRRITGTAVVFLFAAWSILCLHAWVSNGGFGPQAHIMESGWGRPSGLAYLRRITWHVVSAAIAWGPSLVMALVVHDRRLIAMLGSRRPRCPRCGYDLTGLDRRRCPECGLAFGVLTWS